MQVVIIGDDRARPAVPQPMLQCVRAKLSEERQGDTAHLVNGNMRECRLRALRQENADAVPTLDVVREQRIGKAVR